MKMIFNSYSMKTSEEISLNFSTVVPVDPLKLYSRGAQHTAREALVCGPP